MEPRLSPDGERWISAQPDYLFPVHVMGKLFRGKMLAALRQAERRGELRLHDPDRFASLLSRLYRKKWVAYCKRPFGGPEQVISYLGQYTHRVALSNHRLVAMDEHTITFRTKGGQRVTLDVDTFLSRWLGHLVPKRFVKIRHYGLMSSSLATTRLETARRRLDRAGASPRHPFCSIDTPNSPASSCAPHQRSNFSIARAAAAMPCRATGYVQPDDCGTAPPTRPATGHCLGRTPAIALLFMSTHAAGAYVAIIYRSIDTGLSELLHIDRSPSPTCGPASDARYERCPPQRSAVTPGLEC